MAGRNQTPVAVLLASREETNRIGHRRALPLTVTGRLISTENAGGQRADTGYGEPESTAGIARIGNGQDGPANRPVR
jgi:hypothetical protein